MTSIAFDRALERDRGLKAAHRIEEIDIHRRFDVLSASRSRRCGRPSSAETTESSRATEQVTEIIHVEAEIARRARSAGARGLLSPLLIAARFFGIEAGREPGFPEFVIKFAFLWITQDFVGYRNIFELFLGFLVAGIDIRMIFSRQLAIRFANLIRSEERRVGKECR